VLGSELAYEAIDGLDGRLYRWLHGLGHWALALCDDQVAGVAVTTPMADGSTCLFWMEVRPEFRRRGLGAALLIWARSRANGALTIASEEAAVPFYQHCLPAYQQDGTVFRVPAY
jgi:GNAT superfamily N-acetyltransferase